MRRPWRWACKASPVAAQEKTKITWWHISINEPGLSAWQGLADAYMTAASRTSKIEITVLENEAFKQKLATAMQSGDPPDIFQSWGGGVLFEYADGRARQGHHRRSRRRRLGRYLPPRRARPLRQRRQDLRRALEHGRGRLAGTTRRSSPRPGSRRRRPPGPNSSTPSPDLKDAGITPITVGEGDKWPGHFYWVYLAIRSGGKAAFDAAYTREGSFADPPFVQAGALLKELIDLEPFQEGLLGQAYNHAEALLANGQVAMELMGHWSPSNQKSLAENGEGLGEDLGFFLFPAVEGGAGDPSDVLGGGDGFAIGKNASPEAIDFVRFLTSLENQIALMPRKASPSRRSSRAQRPASIDPNIQEIANKVGEAGYLQLYYDQFLPPAVGATVNDAIQGLFAGTASPEEVAQQIEEVAAQEMDS